MRASGAPTSLPNDGQIRPYRSFVMCSSPRLERPVIEERETQPPRHLNGSQPQPLSVLRKVLQDDREHERDYAHTPTGRRIDCLSRHSRTASGVGRDIGADGAREHDDVCLCYDTAAVLTGSPPFELSVCDSLADDEPPLHPRMDRTQEVQDGA
jgi:hypothetical protein